jgi:hypothetical protein
LICADNLAVANDKDMIIMDLAFMQVDKLEDSQHEFLTNLTGQDHIRDLPKGYIGEYVLLSNKVLSPVRVSSALALHTRNKSARICMRAG